HVKNSVSSSRREHEVLSLVGKAVDVGLGPPMVKRSSFILTVCMALGSSRLEVTCSSAIIRASHIAGHTRSFWRRLRSRKCCSEVDRLGCCRLCLSRPVVRVYHLLLYEPRAVR